MCVYGTSILAVYMYVNNHTHAYVCMYVNICVCMYLCMYVACMYVHVCEQPHMRMYVCMYMYVYACMYVVCMYTCIHDIHTHLLRELLNISLHGISILTVYMHHTCIHDIHTVYVSHMHTRHTYTPAQNTTQHFPRWNQHPHCHQSSYTQAYIHTCSKYSSTFPS